MPDMQANPSKPVRDAIAEAEAEKIEAEAGGFVPISPGLDALRAAPPPLVPPDGNLRDLTPEEADPDGGASSPAPDDEPEGRELSGKRVVLYLDTELDTGWNVIANPESQQGVVDPLLYDGNRDEAPKAALDDERNAELAGQVRADPDRFLLVGIPASSWAPAHFKPRVVKTTWTVVR